MAIGKKEKWAAQFSGRVAQALMASAVAARRNGVDLLKDAEILRAAGRTSRATALVILAEEELVKAYLLQMAIKSKRWDSSLFSALRFHGTKQGVGHAIREFSGSVARRADRENRRRDQFLIPPPFQQARLLPDDGEVRDVLAESNLVMSEKPTDKLKQRALYVGIDKGGAPCSTPAEITSADYDRCRALAIGIRDELAGVQYYWD